MTIVNLGAPTLLGDDEESNLLIDLVGDVFENASAAQLTDGAGWILNFVLGGDGDSTTSPTEQQIEQELQSQKNQIAGVQASVTALSDSLSSDVEELTAAIDYDSYSDMMESANSSVITSILNLLQGTCGLSNNSRGTYVPSASDEDFVGSVRDDSLDLLNKLNSQMIGTGGADGLIAAYQKVVWESDNPESDRQIWTTEHLAKMQDFNRYYTSLAVQLFDSYAEAEHWNSAGLPQDPQAAENILSFHLQLVDYLNSWSAASYNNLPEVDDPVVIDTRTDMAWTEQPVVLEGTTAQRYCLDASAMCSAVDRAADGSVAWTRIVPSVGPLNDLIEQQYPGWFIPTSGEWRDFVLGTSSTASIEGIGTWATANAVPMLQPLTYPRSIGTQPSIPSVLAADLGTSTLDWNAPSATPIVRGPGPNSSLAGSLILARQLTALQPFSVLGTTPDPQQETSRSLASAPQLTPAGAPPGYGGTILTGVVGGSVGFGEVASCNAQGYQQPQGVNAVRVEVVGASGGSSGRAPGGAGADVTTTIPLQPGGFLYVQVGGAGQAADAPDNASAGGFGGGGTGGPGISSEWSSTTFFAAGGGGGASGVGLDPGCEQWAVIAGGGGGAGGGGFNHSDGAGGNACVLTGCQGQDTDGAQAGTRITPGNSLSDQGAAGGAGQIGQGGDGGATPVGGDQITGAGGGGGGAGYGGGGGGGFGVSNDGAGGGGGGSFVMDGLSAASFAHASGPAEVIITPILAPEYNIGTVSDDQTHGVLDNRAEGTVNGNPIQRWTANNLPAQSWGLVNVIDNPNDPDANNNFLIANPQTGKCAAIDRNQNAVLTPCASDAALLAWRFQADDDAGNYRLTDVTEVIHLDAELGAQGTAVPETSAPTPLSSKWGLQLSADSMWAAATATGTLKDGVGATDPPPPTDAGEGAGAEPGAVDKTPPSRPDTQSAHGKRPSSSLASTGTEDTALILTAGLLALVTGAGLIAAEVIRRRRRATMNTHAEL